MSKEKQIEEISKTLTDAAHKACEDIPFAPLSSDDRCIRPTMECHRCKEARALIDAGYRKQNEVAWAIFDDIDKIAYRYLNDPEYLGGDMIYDLNELKKKYTGGDYGN